MEFRFKMLFELAESSGNQLKTIDELNALDCVESVQRINAETRIAVEFCRVGESIADAVRDAVRAVVGIAAGAELVQCRSD